MRLKLILTTVIALLISGVQMSYADDKNIDNVLREAESAYNTGQYGRAISLYDSVRIEAGTSADLLINLGSAYARSGDYGRAMLEYLSAERLNPSDRTLRNNIKYLTQKVADNNRAEIKGKKLNVDPDTPSFLSNVRRALTLRVTSDTWSVWSAVCFGLFVICIAMYTFTRVVLIRKIGFFGGITLFGISIITLWCSIAAASAVKRLDVAVITEYKVTLHADASSNSKKVAMPLTRGTVMSVIDTYPQNTDKPEWYKLRLNSDYVGWLPAEDVAIVTPNVNER